MELKRKVVVLSPCFAAQDSFFKTDVVDPPDVFVRNGDVQYYYLFVGEVKMGVKKEFWIVVVCVLFTSTVTADAVTIPLVDPQTLRDSGWAVVVSSGSVVSGVVSVPYVYGVSDDGVVIEIDKVFINPPEEGFFEPLTVEFLKVSSNAVPYIIIEDECVINDTGTEWFDYHMHLVVNTFNPQAGFYPGDIPDGDELENVYYSMYYGYAGLPIALHFIDNNGSGVASLPAGDDLFQPGYLSGRIVIVPDPGLEIGARFGLKEVPSVPEPVTVSLLGIGSTLMMLVKKRRS